MSKTRFPRAVGIEVARELVAHFKPHCERLLAAGSLRRLKREVGDVELVFIPKVRKSDERLDLFRLAPDIDEASEVVAELEEGGIIGKRPNSLGRFAWGDWNKLAVHKATGLPVDLFKATALGWASTAVCRTGPADLNILIASAAQERGWKWHPVGACAGFENMEGAGWFHPETEEELFRFVGFRYAPPAGRDDLLEELTREVRG